jgi:glyoxylase-like metal-dependent hydrolase (beta-lactamase superfamily II)
VPFFSDNLKMFIDRVNYTNTYLLVDDKEAIVIDPALNEHKVNEALRGTNIKLIGIILTHGHYDHIGNTFILAKQWDVPVYVHKKEKDVIQKGHLAEMLNMKPNIDEGIIRYFNDTTLEVGRFHFDVILTPGHTPGSICLKYHNYLFTGDTIFPDSIGRTDLPYGDANAMERSLKLMIAN